MPAVRDSRATSWIRRFASIFGLALILVSVFWLLLVAAGSRGDGALVSPAYADDPPKTKSKEKNGAATKNGASKSSNANDNQNLASRINIIARSIEPRDSDPLIAGEKAKICVNYTVQGGDGDGRFKIGLGFFGIDVQFERVKLEEGDHSECFDIKADQAGELDGRAGVDTDHDVDETDEYDNSVSVTLTWIAPSRPDLLFGGGIELSTRMTDSCDDPVTAHVWMNNDGTAAAKKFDVEAFIDGERVDRKRIEDFDAASQRLLELDKLKFKTAGAHTLLIKMDADNDVDELDEQNNETSANFNNLSCQDVSSDNDD